MKVSSRIYMTTEEVAAKTDLSQRQILNLIGLGRLPSKKVGRLHMVKPSDVIKVKNRPGMGRPKGSKNAKTKAMAEADAKEPTAAKPVKAKKAKKVVKAKK